MVTEAALARRNSLRTSYRQALKSFTWREFAPLDGDKYDFLLAPGSSTYERTKYALVPSVDPVIDDYFWHVAKHGQTLFEWDMIREPFLWKLEEVMRAMQAKYPSAPVPSPVAPSASTESGGLQTPSSADVTQRSINLLSPAPAPAHDDQQLMKRILDTAKDHIGIPFTFQRICELLCQPLRHYKRADKFFRALEKTINVVTYVRPDGARIACEADAMVSELTAEDHIADGDERWSDDETVDDDESETSSNSQFAQASGAQPTTMTNTNVDSNSNRSTDPKAQQSGQAAAATQRKLQDLDLANTATFSPEPPEETEESSSNTVTAMDTDENTEQSVQQLTPIKVERKLTRESSSFEDDSELDLPIMEDEHSKIHTPKPTADTIAPEFPVVDVSPTGSDTAPMVDEIAADLSADVNLDDRPPSPTPLDEIRHEQTLAAAAAEHGVSPLPPKPTDDTAPESDGAQTSVGGGGAPEDPATPKADDVKTVEESEGRKQSIESKDHDKDGTSSTVLPPEDPKHSQDRGGDDVFVANHQPPVKKPKSDK